MKKFATSLAGKFRFLLLTLMVCFVAESFALEPITINLKDKSGLDESVGFVWVAGWINGYKAGNDDTFGVLHSDGTFKTPTTASKLPFYKLSSISTITLDTGTNGTDRLVFVISKAQPGDLPITYNPGSPQGVITQYTQYPYANKPGIPSPGPFDYLEFGYDAAFNMTAVSGFGININFKVKSTGEIYGTDASITRSEIGAAYTTFIGNEMQFYAPAEAFLELIYDDKILPSAHPPPLVDGQFFAISDPHDMLVSKGISSASIAKDDPLATFWDDTLLAFFKVGKWLSVNIGSDIYHGQCSNKLNPKTNVTSPAYVLTNGTYTYTFYMPLDEGEVKPGIRGAEYIFGQAFNDLTPDTEADAKTIQDNIWEAFCRGVAIDGVLDADDTTGASTTAWNKFDNWYKAGKICDFYAKFLHYSTVDGKDSRPTAPGGGGKPIYIKNAAYGFSLDENPDGPYDGPEVPSKSLGNVGGGDTVTITICPFGQATNYSISGAVSGDIKEGVTMTLSGHSSWTTITDADGNYSFPEVASGEYTITPSLAGYTFSPSSRFVTVANASQSGVDFTAKAETPGTYKISGTVSGDINEGVLLTLTGAASDTTTSDAEGDYTFPNLNNGDYTVTPSLSGFSFTPTSLDVTVTDADNTDNNFTASGGQITEGSLFEVNASSVTGLPKHNTFMKKPKVYTQYDLPSGKTKKAGTKLMTEIDKINGNSSVECEFKKKVKLFDHKAFKNAQKNGTSAATWAANTANQDNLHMDLRVSSQEADPFDQSIGSKSMQLPVITNITESTDSDGNATLVIAGKWFGIKKPKVSREYQVEGGTELKQQNMKVLKPTEEDAKEGYKDAKGNPSYMNPENGVSKVVVLIPTKQAKGTLQGIIVLDNKIGIATFADPTN